VQRLVRVAERLLEEAAAVLLLGLCVVTLAQVISRYAFAVSLVWVEEAARFLFTWVIWLGAAVGLRRGQHIAFTFVAERLSRRGQALLGSLVDVMVVGFLGLLVVQGWQVAESVANTTYIAIPWLSVRYAYLVTVLVGGLMLLIQLWTLVDRWRPTRRPV